MTARQTEACGLGPDSDPRALAVVPVHAEAPTLNIQLDRREAEIERRETDVLARESALAIRSELAQAILVAARGRDATADALDSLADQRERESDLALLVGRDGNATYGADWPARRHAKLDREQAKADRLASSRDRLALLAAYDDPRPRGLVSQHPNNQSPR